MNELSAAAVIRPRRKLVKAAAWAGNRVSMQYGGCCFCIDISRHFRQTGLYCMNFIDFQAICLLLLEMSWIFNAAAPVASILHRLAVAGAATLPSQAGTGAKSSWTRSRTAQTSDDKKAGTSCRLHRFSFPIDLSSPCQLTPSLKPGGCPQNSFCLPLTIAAAGAAAEGVTAAETI